MQSEYDVLVAGGGLSGVSCALTAAEAGKKVLLVEKRPALGWESTWAAELNFNNVATPAARRILQELSRVGGLRGNVADAPMLEIVLDRMIRQSGASVLLYAYPSQLIREGKTAFGVTFATRCGEQTIRAKAIVDATEEASLWRQTELRVDGTSQPSARYSFFMNHVEGELEYSEEKNAYFTLHPSVWGGEVRISYPIESCNSLDARRALPDIIRRVRKISQLQSAMVTHAANEPFPLGSAIHFACDEEIHPRIENLFGCGTWLGSIEGTPVGRLALGEQVGRAVSAYESSHSIPESLTPSGGNDQAE